MPLFIPILIIAAGLLTAGAAAAVANAVHESLERTRFAVLGARQTGKTALLTFLTQGTLPTEYIQDVGPKKTKRNTIILEDLKLRA